MSPSPEGLGANAGALSLGVGGEEKGGGKGSPSEIGPSPKLHSRPLLPWHGPSGTQTHRASSWIPSQHLQP